MKSCSFVKKNGIKEHQSISNLVLPSIVESQIGKDYKKNDRWMLYRLKENNLNVWYIVKANRVMYKLTPSKVNEYYIKKILPEFIKKAELINNVSENRLKQFAKEPKRNQKQNLEVFI